MADWVQRAALLVVEPGDFYGTGRLPPATHGGVLVKQTWELDAMSPEPAEAVSRTC
jgi:lipopolysaccharide transport system ATP-binding protein